MKQMSFSRCAASYRQTCFWALAAAALASALPSSAQDIPEEPNAAAVEKTEKYEFRPIEIKPSPDGKNYEGRFLFINKDSSPVTYHGYHEPVDGKFESNFVRFQIFKDKKWEEIHRFLCGTGARDFEITPDKEYQLFVSLDQFKEQGAPLTGRIGFGEFWSEPFVLDWKNDRSTGKFAQAATENFAKVRTQFAKAGFKKELLTGDDFCHRLLESMMKQTSTKGMAASFHPFVGKLDVTPTIGRNGAIQIASQSDEIRKDRTEYTVWFSLDPRNFSPAWFRNAKKRNVEVREWGDGFEMELNNGFADSPLVLRVIYEPFRNSKRPSKEDAERLFLRMLGIFDSWLN